MSGEFDTSIPKAWLLTRLHLEADGAERSNLRFHLGWSGIAVLAVVSYWSLRFVATNFHDIAYDSSSIRPTFSQALTMILIYLSLTSISLLSLTLILGSRSATWGLITFLCVTAALYLIPEIWEVFIVRRNASSAVFSMRDAWQDFRRSLMNFPFAWFAGGASMFALATRNFTTSSTLSAKARYSRPAHPNLLGVPEALILFILLTVLSAIYRVVFRGSYEIDSFLFGLVGMLAGMLVCGCLRMLIYASVEGYSWTLRGLILSYMLSFIFATSFHGVSDSYLIAALASLPIILGGTIFGADWLRGCGWRFFRSEPSQGLHSARVSSDPAWQTPIVTANSFMGCVYLWIGIQNQFAPVDFTVAYPFLVIPASHFMLVYAICRKAHWFLIPAGLVAITWFLTLAGRFTGGAPLIWIAASVIAILCVGQFVFLILKRRQLWEGADESIRYSLAESILLTSLLGAAIGLDVRAPLVAKQSVAERQHANEYAAHIIQELEREFVEAAQNGRTAELEVIEQKLGENGPALGRIWGLLGHTDPLVQIAAVRFIGRMGEKGGYVYGPTSAFVAIIENPSEDIALRRESVYTALVASRGGGGILEKSRRLDDVVELTVEPCTRFLRLPRQRELGLGLVDVVVHLGKLGPAAALCLPELESFLDHSRTADLVPEVVRAIAKIGQNDSIEILQRAAQSPHREIRSAANEELKALDDS